MQGGIDGNGRHYFFAGDVNLFLFLRRWESLLRPSTWLSVGNRSFRLPLACETLSTNSIDWRI